MLMPMLALTHNEMPQCQGHIKQNVPILNQSKEKLYKWNVLNDITFCKYNQRNRVKSIIANSPHLVFEQPN